MPILSGTDSSMRQVIYGDDERFLEWASRRIGVRFRSDAIAIGLVRDDDIGPLPDQDRDDLGRRIVAAVVYDTFSPFDCCVHIASDGSRQWMNREFLIKGLSYPFVQCGFKRITGLVPASNKQAMEFDLHIGFKIEGRCREAAEDGDVFVLGLLRRECRYIPREYRYGR